MEFFELQAREGEAAAGFPARVQAGTVVAGEIEVGEAEETGGEGDEVGVGFVCFVVNED